MRRMSKESDSPPETALDTGRHGPPEHPAWVGHFGNQPEPLFELYCSDRWAASRFAARHDWWLHVWTWRNDENAPAEPEVRLLRLPELDVQDRPGLPEPVAITVLRAARDLAEAGRQ